MTRGVRQTVTRASSRIGRWTPTTPVPRWRRRVPARRSRPPRPAHFTPHELRFEPQPRCAGSARGADRLGPAGGRDLGVRVVPGQARTPVGQARLPTCASPMRMICGSTTWPTPATASRPPPPWPRWWAGATAGRPGRGPAAARGPDPGVRRRRGVPGGQPRGLRPPAQALAGGLPWTGRLPRHALRHPRQPRLVRRADRASCGCSARAAGSAAGRRTRPAATSRCSCPIAGGCGAWTSSSSALIDEPQLDFFARGRRGPRPRRQLILATAVPSWTLLDRDPQAYRNLAYLERAHTAPAGIQLKLTLAGDSHHYSRYQHLGAEEGSAPPTRSPAAAAVRFPHPTHGCPARARSASLPDDLDDVTDYAMITTTPPRGRSRLLSLSALGLALRNPSFCVVPGLVALILLWTASSACAPSERPRGGLRRRGPRLGAGPTWPAACSARPPRPWWCCCCSAPCGPSPRPRRGRPTAGSAGRSRPSWPALHLAMQLASLRDGDAGGSAAERRAAASPSPWWPAR